MDPLILEGGEGATSLERTLSLEEMIVNPDTGILRKIITIPQEAGEPAICKLMTVGNRRLSWRMAEIQRPQSEQSDATFGGTGVSLDAREARVRAIGEGVERYALQTTAELPIVHSSPAKLQMAHVVPASLAPLSKTEQLRFPDLRTYSPDLEFDWISMTDLQSFEPTLVPIAFVTGHMMSSQGPQLSYGSPMGSACANTTIEAVVRASAEALERDALMMAWLSRAPLPRVDLAPGQLEELDLLLSRVHKANLEIHVLDMTNDTEWPAYLALLLDRRHSAPALAMGTGSGADQPRAVLRAIEEAIHMRARFRSLRAAEMTSRDNHFAMTWWNRESLEQLDFLLAEANGTKSAVARTLNPRAAYNLIQQRLRAVGLRAYAVEMSPRDVRTLGLSVAAVVIPGLLPKVTMPGLWHAETPRLKKRVPSLDLNLTPLAFP